MSSNNLHTQLTAAGTVVASSARNRISVYKLTGLLNEDISSSSAVLTIWGAKADDYVEIESVTVASPGVVTATGHGLTNGDIVMVYGSTTTPTLDGFRTVAGVSGATFNLGVNVSSAGVSVGRIYKTEEVITHRAFGSFEYPGPIGYHIGYYVVPAGTAPSMTIFHQQVS
jgi:hypothetical protein